jgi:CheY-like chemotaxis protein
MLPMQQVQMPDLDGFETAALIREGQRTRHIPIIFVAAVYKADHQRVLPWSGGDQEAARRRSSS